jgi:integrase
MSAIRRAVDQYLAMRRRLGFKLELHEFLLRSFAAYLEQQRARHVTTALALHWAQQPARAQPQQWARRLGVVRRFAVHLSASDPRTEIPPAGQLPYRPKRTAPHIYSDAEIERLLSAARQLRSPSGLRAATYTTLLGLLVVTGLRISEAVALDEPDDVDLRAGVLTIRRTKFGKSRLVPIHTTTTRALRRYARLRNGVHPARTTPAFFVGEHGCRLTVWTIRWTFNRLSRQTGLRGPADRRGPRLHDFRHRLAVTTLLHWYRRGVDVEHRLPRLSTFLGHGHVTDTYWYLTAVPELMHLAAKRLEPLEEDPA